MPRTLLALLVVLLCSCSSSGRAVESDLDSYALDSVSRTVSPSEKLSCTEAASALVDYRGERLRYDRPLRIHPAFRSHLVAFELIVGELAREHFGRPPRQIVHFGAFACRAVRGRPELISEHALGNALDVAGFDFGPLPRGQGGAHAAVPASHRRAFQVRLDKHWRGSGKTAPEAAFLRALADQIVARPDVFRVVLGPGFPGHHNHFHLDQAPYRLVGIE